MEIWASPVFDQEQEKITLEKLRELLRQSGFKDEGDEAIPDPQGIWESLRDRE